MTPGREPLPTRVEATPPLPPAYDDALRRGLAELDVALPTTARTAIDGHVRLLLAWTAAINLTAIREPSAVATLHVVDSLSAVPWLDPRRPTRLLDLGSGGGFPGIPLAAALDRAAVTLLEPVAKKARFLETAIAATGLDGRVAVVPARAEALAADPLERGRWAIVTARAVGALADLIELAFPLLEPGGALVAWKRGALDDELAAARRALEALGGGTLDIVLVAATGLAEHRLVVATRNGTVPARYPRDPAARRRRPW